MKVKSLRARLILSTILLQIVLLPIIGVMVKNAFEYQLINATKNELSAHSYALLAEAEVINSQLVLPRQLFENQFNITNSGLYALFTLNNIDMSTNNVIWFTPSFSEHVLPNIPVVPHIGDTLFTEIALDNRPHFLYQFSVVFAGENSGSDLSVTLLVIKDKKLLLEIVSDFEQKLWIWLFGLMSLILVFQLMWLKWTLKPLSILKSEIKSIEQGESTTLSYQYPEEIEQITTQLNELIQSEHLRQKRYQHALSDLAHSLKTPLAVIQSEQSLTPQIKQQILLIEQTISKQLTRAKYQHNANFGMRINIKHCIDKLISSLNKIYTSKQLSIECQCAESAMFFGDESDLLELLGNLLDNACKAASSRVVIIVTQNEMALTIEVSDDGLGIAENEQSLILERGTRTDTYAQGHGIGLAIVKDIVNSYQGELTIGNAVVLSGASFKVSFTKQR